MPSTPPPLTLAQAARSAVHAYRDALHRVRDDESLGTLAGMHLLSERRTDAVSAILRINDAVGDATVGTPIGERVVIAAYCSRLARLVLLGAIGPREVDEATIMLSRIAAAIEARADVDGAPGVAS